MVGPNVWTTEWGALASLSYPLLQAHRHKRSIQPRDIRLPGIPVMDNEAHREIKNIPPLQLTSFACQRIDRQRPPIRHEPGKPVRAGVGKQRRPACLPAATVPEQSTQSDTLPLIAPPPTRPSASIIVAPFVMRRPK